MALKAILDTVEGLPDAIKSEYTANAEGKFVLSVEGVNGFELEDVSGLKNTLALVNGNMSNAEKELKKFGSSWDKETKTWKHTLDPVKAKTAVSKYDEFVNFDPAKEGDKIAEAKVNSIKDQLVAEHTTEVAAKDEEIGVLSATVNNLLIKQQATMALAEQKGDAELLMPHIERMTRVTRKGNDFVVEVLDKDKNVRIGDGKGNPMTIAQLVEEMKLSPSFGKAFEGDGKGGSGMQSQRPGGGSPAGLKRSQMSPQQKADFQEKHGAQEFLKLPK